MSRMSSAGKVLTVAAVVAGIVFLAAHADASSGSAPTRTPTAKTTVSHASPTAPHDRDV